MQGTLFLIAIVVLGLMLVVFGMSTIFLVPFVVIGLAVAFGAPIIAALRGSGGRGTPSSEPSGVPSTREASYDPVQEP
jgi:type IV secretory pathway VirB2 component (pilin)